MFPTYFVDHPRIILKTKRGVLKTLVGRVAWVYIMDVVEIC